jgi:hypothetical protein
VNRKRERTKEREQRVRYKRGDRETKGEETKEREGERETADKVNM